MDYKAVPLTSSSYKLDAAAYRISSPVDFQPVASQICGRASLLAQFRRVQTTLEQIIWGRCVIPPVHSVFLIAWMYLVIHEAPGHHVSAGLPGSSLSEPPPSAPHLLHGPLPDWHHATPFICILLVCWLTGRPPYRWLMLQKKHSSQGQWDLQT